MHFHSRYHIKTHPVPLPTGNHPADFEIAEGGNYVKYGHPVFRGTAQRGDVYWTAEIITQTWYQAETGNIPISGAGYGGKFAGEGFDGIWLDMSEIVRPTRDGIHGREYISTQVDVGISATSLSFDSDGRITELPQGWFSLPIPVIFNPLPMLLPGTGAARAAVRAAYQLGTVALIEAAQFDVTTDDQHQALALRVTGNPHDLPATLEAVRYIEAEDSAIVEELSQIAPHAIIGVRISLGDGAAERAIALAQNGVRCLHVYADEVLGLASDDTPLPHALQDVHVALVNAGLRDQVTIVASGGIAAAEHVAKAIACGADLVAIDFAMMVAWGCSLWADKGPCPVEHAEIDEEWGAQRLVNLMNAWRDQLLEALGAMGIREVRRLRGEVGRTIWQHSEEELFRKGLGGSLPRQDYPTLPEHKGGEGDFRWPLSLLLSSQEQSRTGQPPSGSVEYRIGQSDGGFDRIALNFELDHDPQDIPSADPSNFDMSLSLNRRDDGRPHLDIPLPWYGAGMSYGSIGFPVMLARARAAQALGTFMSTGEGGYPDALASYADSIITQVATGLFGVREDTLQRAPILEIKYAQGAKPGLGGHLLGNKNTESVAEIREAVQGTSLFSPFPFHSVYSVEDHKKHVDWLKQVNSNALISVKVSTPTDVDMVAVGSYYAGAHIIHLDGAYGGTGAAPEIAKKNIAMPIEYAIPRVHRFLISEGIRDDVTLMVSGGLRTAFDVAKAIALGADGAILGTAELVAIGCIRIAQCEKGLGCPFGITTTDPEHARKIDADVGWQRIVNLYTGWLWQLAGILERFGMKSVAELRGRSDLLLYLENEGSR